MVGNVSLIFMGDIYYGSLDVSIGDRIREITLETDIVTANIEGPLTAATLPCKRKSVHLRNDPAGLKHLKNLSLDLACLANNHICDWGKEGVRDTLRLLKKNNISHVGLGLNIRQATKPVIFRKNALRIGFLAFGAEEIDTIPAGEESFGCAVLDGPHMLATVTKLASQTDVVVVGVHWGSTNYHHPFPEHVALGRSLIDAGATVVVGHHPHVIQGYERHANGAILYSLGNFIFAQYTRRGKLAQLSQENHTGMLAEVGVTSRGVEWVRFIHTRHVDVDDKMQSVGGYYTARRGRLLQKLSKPLSQSNYSSFFRWYTLRRIGSRGLWWLNPRRWKNISHGQLASLGIAIRRIITR